MSIQHTYRELHPRILEVLNMPASHRIEGWKRVAKDATLPFDVQAMAANILIEVEGVTPDHYDGAEY